METTKVLIPDVQNGFIIVNEQAYTNKNPKWKETIKSPFQESIFTDINLLNYHLFQSFFSEFPIRHMLFEQLVESLIMEVDFQMAKFMHNHIIYAV